MVCGGRHLAITVQIARGARQSYTLGPAPTSRPPLSRVLGPCQDQSP